MDGGALALALSGLVDRIAIRELVDAYAHCADRRDAAGQMALFAEDTRFVVFMDAQSPTPTQTVEGRAGLAPIFEHLNIYRATTHFNGQSTVQLDGDHATGVSYCLAHHVADAGDVTTLTVASIRYLDQFVRIDCAWRFAERKLLCGLDRDAAAERPADRTALSGYDGGAAG
jgi:ketosteroid isomerase-like protein